ncbi:hypothetical protein EMIHUDRAFT_244982 [Emiliania huxleyi CCMP1516]|uniref:B30.2/SPRY domain-containing protein n=2 Tax=Emiliania huxleyi TaxID=2903 RepID=A0A0D3IYL7_EMIH1|nr:hypothetical protein EMIHUDRAFT_210724 [Emiliania huxleyi CCMP1516]XP_005768988.1 hypothetical protein EMIHUDRAFT_244982 [Emiliania huxleyi CCMP1516]EOD16352.1 hypothetical protein EMIHUDRAFT_210724 [Emiliania huxleyi CCMP1516]EOD16559.1 hypothetical protein EMIHUDRAFT_244982 [Emiliania huxleyi CCMP1516]|eukprot:XP_005768781.1 hypothetical protein EMIHUDRAFT_210724 [Emiliania huxleyi CCMP1516]
MEKTQQVTEAFDWGFQRDSKAQLAYEAPKKVLPTLGQHGDNVRVGGGVIATRTGGSDASAVVVGSTGIQLMHPAQRGQGTFSWTIRKSQGNDGLGLYVGVADADADFLSDSWGKAWAMGCHGCNDSLEDGTTVTVKVDLSASPRTLSFSINGGAEGDSVSLAYDDAPSRSSSIDETASEAAASLRTSEARHAPRPRPPSPAPALDVVWTKTERVSPGDVMSFLA